MVESRPLRRCVPGVILSTGGAFVGPHRLRVETVSTGDERVLGRGYKDLNEKREGIHGSH